jgi:hypothetical protein
MKILSAIVALLVLLCTSSLRAEVDQLPFDLQAKLLLKILVFDRNLEKRVDSTVVVGIMYDPENQESNKAKSGLCRALDNYLKKKVKGFAISYRNLEYTSTSDLSSKMKSYGITVLYVTPGNVGNLEGLIGASQKNSVLTASCVGEYVEKGISVGLGLKNNKPQITINLPSAQAEGCDFSSQLLKLAKVIE